MYIASGYHIEQCSFRVCMAEAGLEAQSLGILEKVKEARRMCDEHKNPFLSSFIIGCDGQRQKGQKRNFLKK